jgi:integrase
MPPVLAAPGEPPAVVDLIDEARRYANATRSDNTKRAYESDWADFTAWAASHGLAAMPAAPTAVALYITALARTHKPSTIGRRLAAISVAHQRTGHASPTIDVRVREVMRGIRRSVGTAPDEARPLTISELRRVCARMGETTIDVRDRALLMIGFAGGLRRSEIVNLDIADITPCDEGIALTIRRSKTDQEGAGRRVAIPRGRELDTCPVSALHVWLAALAAIEGPLFRSVDRHGNVALGRLSAQAVNLIIKRAVRSIGLDGAAFSGHSLRAGFATTAAASGASERAIANQTGHRSMEVLRRYVRHGSLFTDNAVNALGL